jgi:superfamily I DNA/RNA helicase
MGMAKAALGPYYDSAPARKAVCDLVSRAKGCLVDGARALDDLADAAGIEFPRNYNRETLIKLAADCLRRCREASEGPIDFDDMIWLPVVRDLPLPTYDYVFVDETQDLNPAQLEIVIRAAGDKGRIIAVGDRRQSIYQFRGADAQAIPNMIRRLNAKVLPLSITYRCPRAVVTEAQGLVPAIEAREGAAEGIVREASEEILKRDAQPGDFVISRVNAPLISLAFAWIAEGRRAVIKGRDIGTGLATWIKSAKAGSVPHLARKIREWREAEIKRLTAAERPTQAVEDKAACLEALCEGAKDVPEVLSKVERLFGDANDRNAITLTSTHKAKGLEADRVWLLSDTYCRWPGIEEDNLLYVAITRSKGELIYVTKAAEVSAAPAVERLPDELPTVADLLEGAAE